MTFRPEKRAAVSFVPSMRMFFPEARARDDEPGERRARQKHDEGHGDEANHLRGEHVAERWGYAGDGFAFGEDQGDAAEEFEGAEGGEDRRDFEDRRRVCRWMSPQTIPTTSATPRAMRTARPKDEVAEAPVRWSAA